MNIILRLIKSRNRQFTYKEGIPQPRGKIFYFLSGKRKLESLEKKARSGDIYAQVILASSLLFGTHGSLDTRESLMWTNKALKAGSPVAKYLYGFRHMVGIDVVKDPQLALRWWREAANEGDVHAMSHLAWAFQLGFGTDPDPVKAIQWIDRAARHGHRSAQYVLGVNYFGGEAPCNYYSGGGLEKDLEKAYFWLCLAAYRGDKHAREVSRKIKTELAPITVNAIELAAQEWRPAEGYQETKGRKGTI